MKKVDLLENEESKKQCYIYVGQQIKYEPGWVNDYQKHNIKTTQNMSVNHRGFLEHTGVRNNSKSVTQGLNQRSIRKSLNAILKKKSQAKR